MMKKFFSLLIMAMVTIGINAQSVTTWYNESMQKQLQAMELGEVEFTPKEYYRFLHGKPDALNLWLGDNYAVYDHNWHWAGLHSGFRWDFNAEKSKAQNVFPYRLAYTATDSLTANRILAMRDTLLNQVEREVARAADCEIDLYYPVYKDLFDKYDSNITCSLTDYLVNCGSFVNSSFQPGDKLGIKENTILELNKIRELVTNTHNAYMESTLKEEMYNDILDKYKKLAWMVSLNEKASRCFVNKQTQ